MPSFGQQGDSYLDRTMTGTGLGEFRRSTHQSPKWVVGSHQTGMIRDIFTLPPSRRRKFRRMKNVRKRPNTSLDSLDHIRDQMPYKRSGAFGNPFHEPRFTVNGRKHFTPQNPAHMHIPCSPPSRISTDPYFLETLSSPGANAYNWQNRDRGLLSPSADPFPPVSFGGGGRTWSTFPSNEKFYDDTAYEPL